MRVAEGGGDCEGVVTGGGRWITGRLGTQGLQEERSWGPPGSGAQKELVGRGPGAEGRARGGRGRRAEELGGRTRGGRALGRKGRGSEREMQRLQRRRRRQ